MINAGVTTHKGRILRIQVQGHALSDDYGKDLVCVEVSAVTTGLCNAIDEAGYEIPMKVKSGYVSISADGDDSHDLQVILKTGISQLKTIEYVHSDFLKIHMTEV
ncbi:MAG: ribosomal-processing cysteine protease Prp [Solobacterium sp.]|nr:ribosomal-processing cysteine protease Prp [Solobacterium sp.]